MNEETLQQKYDTIIAAFLKAVAAGDLNSADWIKVRLMEIQALVPGIGLDKTKLVPAVGGPAPDWVEQMYRQLCGEDDQKSENANLTGFEFLEEEIRAKVDVSGIECVGELLSAKDYTELERLRREMFWAIKLEKYEERNEESKRRLDIYADEWFASMSPEQASFAGAEMDNLLDRVNPK
jgi:hypothetical protein